MYKEITQAIIDLLKNHATLGRQVKQHYFGEHDIRLPGTRFPFIDVKWRGGPVDKTKTGTTKTRRRIDFIIRIIDKDINEDLAEKSVMAKTELIETILDASGTLSDTCISHRVKEVISDSINEGGYSIVGSITRIEVKK